MKLYCPSKILQSLKNYLSLAANLLYYQLLSVDHIWVSHTGLIAVAK